MGQKISTYTVDKAMQDKARVDLYLFMLKLLWRSTPIFYDNLPAIEHVRRSKLK